MADITKNMVLRITQSGARETAQEIGLVDQAQKKSRASSIGVHEEYLRGQGIVQRLRDRLSDLHFEQERAKDSATLALINKQIASTQVELTNATVGTTSALSSFGSGSQAARTAVYALSGQLAAAGVPMRGMSSMLGVLAGPTGFGALTIAAVGVAAILPTVISGMSGVSEEAKKQHEEFKQLNDEWNDFLISLGQVGLREIGIGVLMSELDAVNSSIEDFEDRIKRAKAERDREGEAFVGGGLGRSGDIGDIIGDTEKLNEKLKRREEILLEVAKREKDIFDFNMQSAEAAGVILSREQQIYDVKNRQLEIEKELQDAMKIRPPGTPDEDDPLEHLRRLETERQALDNALIMLRSQGAAEKDLLGIEKDREGVSAEILRITGKKVDNDKDSLRALHSSVSAVSGIRSGLAGLEVETGAWLDQLLSAVQTLVSILELVSAIKVLTSIFSFGAGTAPGLSEGIPDLGMPVPGGGEAFRGTVVIQAMDARSFDQFLRSPDNRQRLSNNIGEIIRKGH